MPKGDCVGGREDDHHPEGVTGIPRAPGPPSMSERTKRNRVALNWDKRIFEILQKRIGLVFPSPNSEEDYSLFVFEKPEPRDGDDFLKISEKSAISHGGQLMGVFKRR